MKPKLRRSGAIDFDEQNNENELAPSRKGSSKFKPKLRRSGALELDEELQMP